MVSFYSFFLLLCSELSFYLFEGCVASQSIIITALKFLSISTSESSWICQPLNVFPLGISHIFLILSMSSTFGLYTEYFEPKVRIWILLKSSDGWGITRSDSFYTFQLQGTFSRTSGPNYQGSLDFFSLYLSTVALLELSFWSVLGQNVGKNLVTHPLYSHFLKFFDSFSINLLCLLFQDSQVVACCVLFFPPEI